MSNNLNHNSKFCNAENCDQCKFKEPKKKLCGLGTRHNPGKCIFCHTKSECIIINCGICKLEDQAALLRIRESEIEVEANSDCIYGLNHKRWECHQCNNICNSNCPLICKNNCLREEIEVNFEELSEPNSDQTILSGIYCQLDKGRKVSSIKIWCCSCDKEYRETIQKGGEISGFLCTWSQCAFYYCRQCYSNKLWLWQAKRSEEKCNMCEKGGVLKLYGKSKHHRYTRKQAKRYLGLIVDLHGYRIEERRNVFAIKRKLKRNGELLHPYLD